MKLLESAKSSITKDETGENFPHLEITEVALVQCNIVNNDYQRDSRVLHTLTYLFIYLFIFYIFDLIIYIFKNF